MRKLWRRIYFFANRRRLQRELAEEMEIHRALLQPDRRTIFGNTTRLQEEATETWSWIWLQQLWQDLFYAVRVLRGAPGFTLGAVAVLALGIGVNLAEFQIFDAIMRRAHVHDASSLLQFLGESKQGRRAGFPVAAVEFYRAQSHSFAWLVSEDTSVEMTLEGDTGVRSSMVSATYFSSLGVVPAWGRLLSAPDAEPGAPAVAVLSYPYWQSHFGSDPKAVGKVVRINNQPVQIIGVTPYDFDGLSPRMTAVYLPVSLRPALIAGSPPLAQDFARASEALFGKLKPGVAVGAGEAELTSLTHELIHRNPRSFREDERIEARPLQDSFLHVLTRSPAFASFVVMVLLVLFSACANLGNMLLARGLARQREIHIRVAIGASRARLVRQLMTENLLLALLGSVAGAFFGVAASRLLWNALDVPFNVRLPLSWPLVLVGLILTVISVVAFGLPSALQTVRPTHRGAQLRQTLIGAQVAVSCLLLIASGVLAHKAIRNASLDVTFDYEKMMVVYTQLYARNLPPTVARQKLDALSTRLKGVPGIADVALAVVPPFSGRLMLDSLPGLPHVSRNAVGASYFSLMNLPVVRGRTFLPEEHNAVIVSESAARAVWPNQDPIGKVWTLAGAERTVTGVVKDSGANLLFDPESIEAYVPIEGVDVERSALILRSHTDPATLVRMVAATALGSGESVSALAMRSLRENVIQGQERAVMIIGSLGTVSSALAAVGMFALVSFAVAQRKREFGIRIAIGAKPRHILDLLLKQNAAPMAGGALAGVFLAVILARVVGSAVALRGNDSVDLLGFAAGLAGFGVVAVLATLSPAMRALRIDPSTTLREE
jgi:predicted permease